MFFFAVSSVYGVFASRHGSLQNSVYRFVNYLFVERAVFNRLNDEFVVHAAARRHFEVVTCFDALYSFVGCAPVAYHNTFKAPFVSQYLVEDKFVFCSVGIVDEIVRRHDSTGLRKFDGDFERHEIYFSQSTLVNCRID